MSDTTDDDSSNAVCSIISRMISEFQILRFAQDDNSIEEAEELKNIEIRMYVR